MAYTVDYASLSPDAVARRIKRERIRTLVKGMYDIQELRVATGNRIVASMRPSLVDSVASRVSDEDKEAQDKAVQSALMQIAKEYDQITQYFVEQFKARGSVQKSIDAMSDQLDYIKSKIDYEIVQSWGYLRASETTMLKSIEAEIKAYPLWDEFFAKVKGCGPLMAAVCIAYLDPYAARTPSSFWKYAGLDVVRDEKGNMVGRRRWHTEDREYTVDGEVKTKKSLTYNPFLKTKLVGVLGTSFLRARDSEYGKIYYDYKNRLDNRPPDAEGNTLRPAAKHRMATRYAVKMFLKDLWVAWREFEDLPVVAPYSEVYLGREPHGAPRNQPLDKLDLQ